jgi:thioredoxin-like negative regulator of GroEL
MSDFDVLEPQKDAPNLEQLLQMAASTLKRGNQEGARVLVQQVLDADNRNDRAWVLLAYTTNSLVDRRRYLRTALRLNPENKAAKRGLDKLKQARSKSENQAMYYGTIGLVIVLVITVIACVAILLIS